MLPRNIYLNRQDVQALRDLAYADPAKLTAACRALEREEAAIAPGQIRQLLEQALGDPEQAVSAADILTELAIFRRKAKLDGKSVLELVKKNSGIDNWGHEDKNKLETITPVLISLIENRTIFLTAKAIDIAEDHSNIFWGCRIFVDARPVFDEKKSNVVGFAAVHILRLEYLGSNGSRNDLSIYMTASDLENISESCRDALSKAGVVRQLVESRLALDVLPADRDDR